jgi:hypothetical protein
MGQDSWTILFVDKGPGMIEDSVKDALKMSACLLQVKRVDRMRISTSVCTGVIETEWKTYVVGGRSGVLFSAQVDSDKGEYQVNFLLNEDDLQRGGEVIKEMEEGRGKLRYATRMGKLPVDELYKFHDLRRSRLGKSLN